MFMLSITELCGRPIGRITFFCASVRLVSPSVSLLLAPSSRTKTKRKDKIGANVPGHEWL